MTPTRHPADALPQLVSLAPDAIRAAAVRHRCHARLARRRAREDRRARARRLAAQVVAPAVAGAFCLLYFASLASYLLDR